GVGAAVAGFEKRNENPSTCRIAITKTDFCIRPVGIHEALGLMRRHVNDIHSPVLAASPRGTGPDPAQPPAGVRNTCNDAYLVAVEVAAAVRMNSVVKHMPIERAVSVVNFLTGLRTGSVGRPRHQHPVRGHDLNFMPASAAVLRA